MRLSEIVVDKSEMFKQKKADNAAAHIQSIASAVQDAFEMQPKLEAWAAEQLIAIDKAVNALFKDDLLKLRPLTKEYQASTPILEVLYFTAEDDEYSRAYCLANKDKIRSAILLGRKMLADFVEEANKFKWPAPWQRYTRYSYIHHRFYMTYPYAFDKIFEKGWLN